MTTRIRGREPSPGTPARPRGEPAEPVRRSAAIAAARSTPALTGAQRPSQGAGREASRGSWGPPSWVYDYTTCLDSHATPGARARVAGAARPREDQLLL